MRLNHLVLALALSPLAAPHCFAQAKLLKIVVPYPPGGSPDNTARVLGEKISRGGKYNVVIENRPGAGGVLAVDTVKNSPPDGSVILMGDSSTYSISPNVKRKISYDPLRDFKPVGLAATSPIFLVTQPSTANTVADFVANLKKEPGQMYGSSGYGTAHHLAMEMFRSITNVDMGHVPYKGATQTVPAVAAGDVIATFAGLTAARSFSQVGKVKILAIAEPERSSMAPEIPTLAESGLPGYNVTISLGFLANRGTPDATIRDLNTEISKAVRDPDVKIKLNALGVEPATSTPERFGEMIKSELASFGKIVKAANIRED